MMQDDALRQAKAVAARYLGATAFKWDRERKKYLGVYETVLGLPRAQLFGREGAAARVANAPPDAGTGEISPAETVPALPRARLFDPESPAVQVASAPTDSKTGEMSSALTSENV